MSEVTAEAVKLQVDNLLKDACRLQHVALAEWSEADSSKEHLYARWCVIRLVLDLMSLRDLLDGKFPPDLFEPGTDLYEVLKAYRARCYGTDDSEGGHTD